jgi:hypothetical protein
MYLSFAILCYRFSKNDNITHDDVMRFIDNLKPPLNKLYYYLSGGESLPYLVESKGTNLFIIVFFTGLIGIGFAIHISFIQQADYFYESFISTAWLLLSVATIFRLRIWRFGHQLNQDLES